MNIAKITLTNDELHLLLYCLHYTYVSLESCDDLPLGEDLKKIARLENKLETITEILQCLD